jgi:hypothetical protein
MRNGGWLDSYADGGTMQEHQENYNDYKVSAPEGFQGTGYSNVGRDYSPAWGGQFEDGGEIPMAQKGKKLKPITTNDPADPRLHKYLDSLNLYKGYELSKKYNKQGEYSFPNAPKGKVKYSKSNTLPHKSYEEYLKFSNEYDKRFKKAYDKGGMNAVNADSFLSSKQGRQTSFSKKEDLYKYDPAAKALIDQYEKLSFKEPVETGYWKTPDLYHPTIRDIGSYYKGAFNPIFKKPNQEVIYSGNPKDVEKLRQKPYIAGVTNPKIQKQVILQKPIQAIENNLQPIGIQNDFNIEADVPQIRPQAIMPKSFDITSQRQTMSGPSDYYNYNQQGLSIEQALEAKRAADAYNQSIQDKYGNSKNPEAQERLKQLMQDVELTPNYQMGGSVYPVNYVPQAQDGENLNTPENWEKSIRNIEHQIGNPNEWSIDGYRQLQKQVNEYKFWRENTPEGKAVYDSHNESNEYVVPLPDHLKMYKPLNMLEEVTPNYKKVGVVPQAQGGYRMGTYFDEDAREIEPNMMEETYDDYRTAMEGMMKSKMATQATLGNKSAQRMMSSNPSKYIFTGNERFSDGSQAEGAGAYGTHYMSNRDNYVYPNLQDNGEGILNFIPNASPSDREAMRFENADEADYFANHYKEVAPMMKANKMQMGGSMPGAVGFTYARTKGIPSEGPYAKKTLPSAQNGGEMRYYQNGLDWKPKGMKDGGWLDGYDKAEEGEKIKIKERPTETVSESTGIGQNMKIKLNKNVKHTLGEIKKGNNIVKKRGNYVVTANNKVLIPVNRKGQQQQYVPYKQLDPKEKLNQEEINKIANYKEALDKENLGIGSRPLIYLESPEKILGDIGIPGMETSEDDRLRAAQLYNHPDNANMSMLDVMSDSFNYGVRKVPGAALNTALAMIGNPNAGPLRVIGEAMNPLPTPLPGRGMKINAGDDVARMAKQADNVQDTYGLIKEKNNPLQFDSEINWGKEYFEKIQNKEKELQDLVFSKKITEKEYLEGVPLYEKELAKELGLENKLGSGNYGKVFESPNDASKVIKLGNPMSAGGTGASNWTPELIEKLKSIKQNANIAVPEQVEYFEIPSLYQGYGPKTKEVMTMPNLNQVAAENLNLNKRDRYALFLKQARQLRDQGIQLDVKNIENFKFNKDKGVFDIYDINPGYISNPGYYMQDVVNKTRGPLFENMQFKQGGIIKDDRGQWDHPGEITEINSPYITMQGVPYPVLGISDTGDTKLMKPGKNYKFKGKKVTEFPMAQNGIKTFYNDYINSPKYKERLELQNYNNPDKVVSDRSKHLMKTKLNTIKDTGGFTANNTGSYYTPETNTVDYDEFDLKLYPGSTSEDIKTHELSHAVSALSPRNKSNLTLNKNEVTEINSRNKNKQEHEKDPEEAKADMDVLRYHLKKDKLYDTGKEEFTPELYNAAKKKYKNNQTIKRFFNRFSDKDAIYLMNSIAQLNDKDEYVPMAKNGLRQEQKGLVNLDNLLNFTNYNTQQPGGWLDTL